MLQFRSSTPPGKALNAQPQVGTQRTIRADKCGLRRPDRLGFVTYAIAGAQSGHMMRAYRKQPPSPPSEQLVESLLGYAIVAHWDCARDDAAGHAGSWTYVPSLSSGRPGDHPIGALARPFLPSVPYVPVGDRGDDGRAP